MKKSLIISFLFCFIFISIFGEEVSTLKLLSNNDIRIIDEISGYSFGLSPEVYTQLNEDYRTSGKKDFYNLVVVKEEKKMIFPLFHYVENGGKDTFAIEDIILEDQIGDESIEIILDGSISWEAGYHGGTFKKRIFLNIIDDQLVEIFNMIKSTYDDVGYCMDFIYNIESKNKITMFTIDRWCYYNFSSYSFKEFNWDNGKFNIGKQVNNQYTRINGNDAIIRKDPDFSSDIVTRVQPDHFVNIESRTDNKVVIDGKEDYWYKVNILSLKGKNNKPSYNDDIVIENGWIFGNNLDFIEKKAFNSLFTYNKNWIFDERHWNRSCRDISFLGKGVDSAAWINKNLTENVEVSFKWKIESDTSDDFELLFMIFGGGGLVKSFWNDGINISYKVDKGVAQSWIRVNGIYDNHHFLNDENNVSVFLPNVFHDGKIIVKDNLITFSINGTIIQDEIPFELNNMDGFFGVANYWENDSAFTIKDVIITSL